MAIDRFSVSTECPDLATSYEIRPKAQDLAIGRSYSPDSASVGRLKEVRLYGPDGQTNLARRRGVFGRNMTTDLLMRKLTDEKYMNSEDVAHSCSSFLYNIVKIQT